MVKSHGANGVTTRRFEFFEKQKTSKTKRSLTNIVTTLTVEKKFENPFRKTLENIFEIFELKTSKTSTKPPTTWKNFINIQLFKFLRKMHAKTKKTWKLWATWRFTEVLNVFLKKYVFFFLDFYTFHNLVNFDCGKRLVKQHLRFFFFWKKKCWDRFWSFLKLFWCFKSSW